MSTIVTFTTGCGHVLAREEDAVYALSPCCRQPADWAGHCPACFRSIGEGYLLAALVGSKTYARDLRQCVEALGCTDPVTCRDEILAALGDI